MLETITDSAPASILQKGRGVKLLAFGDSPVFSPEYGITGFGRVMRNLLARWHGAEAPWGADGESPSAAREARALPVEVECWAIGFDGFGYDQVPYQLYPAGKHDWRSPARLNRLLKVLADGQYTHLFMLMDPDALSVHDRTSAWHFPQKLRQVCKAKNIRVLLYYPVDAPLEREWLGILDACDVAVAYTEYGRNATRAALGKSLYPVEVVPHGVDDCFKPLSVENRAKARVIELLAGRSDGSDGSDGSRVKQFVQEGDFLMVNVNKNEWRKDPLRSLEILRALRREKVPAKLMLRMDPMSAMGGVHLDVAAKQLGLTYGKEYCHVGPVGDEALVALYNAADLYLTTSLGEGWGLGVTEAMACHCPVAMPRHTSLAEIGLSGERRAESGERIGGPIWLPLEDDYVCGADTRLRRRVHVDGAVKVIMQAYGLRCGDGVRCAPAEGGLKSWDWVAERLMGLMVGEHS